MKLLSKIKIKIWQLLLLDGLGLIESSELWVLMDIFNYMKLNPLLSNMDEKEVIKIRLYHIDKIPGVEIELITKSNNSIIIPIGDYGCDDYFFLDIPNSLRRIFTITKFDSDSNPVLYFYY